MNALTNIELNNVKGGAFKWGLAFALTGIFSFIAGVIDGIINPIKCNNR